MKTKLLAMPLAASLAALAMPRVDQEGVAVSYDDQMRKMSISYRLDDEPAVITIDIQTNNTETGAWESIGGASLASMVGDVNKVVTNSTDRRTAYWIPGKDWPERLVTGTGVRAVVKAWATNAPPDWMVVDLLTTNCVRYYATEESIPLGVSNRLYKTEKLVMRKVPAAGIEWRMGIEDWQPASLHFVTFTEDYYLGIYEMTQEQYRNAYKSSKVSMPGNSTIPDFSVPSVFKNLADSAIRPVERVSYADLRGDPNSTVYDWPHHLPLHDVDPDSFLGKFRDFTGVEFDLPTEAQWEYACRAGEQGRAVYWEGVSWGNAGWWLTNSASEAYPKGETHPVGTIMRNKWGFCDVHGNVDEWCLDYWVQYMPDDDVVDPVGPPAATIVGSTTDRRVVRGGNFTEVNDVNSALYRGSAGGRMGNRESPGGRYSVHGFRLCSPAMAR